MKEEEVRKKEAEKLIDKKSMVKIIEEIFMIYMSKKVNNFFKTTLIEVLQTRMKMKNELISDYL